MFTRRYDGKDEAFYVVDIGRDWLCARLLPDAGPRAAVLAGPALRLRGQQPTAKQVVPLLEIAPPVWYTSSRARCGGGNADRNLARIVSRMFGDRIT